MIDPYPLSIYNTIHRVQSFLSAIQSLVPGNNRLVELDHESGAFVPVSGDLSGEAAVSEDGLHDAGGEGGTVQAAVLLRHRDVGVDKRLFLYDVIRLVVVVGLLQLVRLLTEQRLPHINLDEEQHVQHFGLPLAVLLSQNQHVQHAGSDALAHVCQPGLQLGYRVNSALTVLDHLREEQGEGAHTDFSLWSGQRPL